MDNRPEDAPVPYRRTITICIMIATLMQSLDSTIANVALPYMQGSLSTTSDQIAWVLTSYIAAAAIMTGPVGWLAQHFGRKNLFIVCIAGFTTASMLCGAAESLSQMVIFRLVQGMFGAALVPLSQATILDIYPPEQRGQAMAIFSTGVVVGPIVGPTLGGFLTENYNWRWVFYVNLPFGIMTGLGILLFMSNTLRDKELKFDWIGFAALGLGVGSLQIMLDRGEQLSWFDSREIIIEAVLAALGFYLFVVHIFTAKKPFIPPRIFLDINFVASCMLMFALGMILISSSALLAPWLQTLGDYPVSTAGLLMAPRGVGTLFALLLVGHLANRFDSRLLIAFGIFVLAYSLYEMSLWTPDVSAHRLVIVSIIQGLGFGFVFNPAQVIAFSTLSSKDRTDGTAMFSLVRNTGSAIGISIMQFLIVRNSQIMHANLTEFITPFNRMLQTGTPEVYWDPFSQTGAAFLDRTISNQSAIIAYADDFRLMMYITLPTLLLLLFMPPS